MISTWLVRVNKGVAYVWKRKYFLGIIAIPWRYHGATWIFFTPDAHDDVLDAALDYIFNLPENLNEHVTIKLESM